MIKVSQLNLKLGNFILKDIDFNIKKGEYFVLLGPTGAGKSVLLETIIGLNKPDKGSIKLNSLDVVGLAPEERNVGYLAQDLALFPHLSVKENILFGAKAKKISPKESNERLKELSEMLDIKHLLGRGDIKTLSGGEKQRVALARSLILNPSVLFLDEPCASLDEVSRRQILMQFKSINRLLGVTIFHVTHNRDEAFILADRMGVIFNGQIEQIGKWVDFYENPASIFVARFLLGANIFEGKILRVNNSHKKELELQINGLNIITQVKDGFKEGDFVFAGIRPEEIAIIRSDRPISEKVEKNIFTGIVSSIYKIQIGYIITLKVEGLNDILEANITSCAFRDLDISEGKALQFSIKKESIWLLKKS